MYIQSIYLFGCTKNLNDYDAQTILCRNKICININHFFFLLIAILFVTYVKKTFVRLAFLNFYPRMLAIRFMINTNIGRMKFAGNL